MSSASPDQAPQTGTKRFGMTEQALFAALSSDRNPMHMDVVAARRLLTGRPVVHGIHVLMTALEFGLDDPETVPVALECSFNNAVSVDEPVVFRQRRLASGQIAIEASVDDLPCTKIRLTTAGAAPLAQSAFGAGPAERAAVPLDDSAAQHLQVRTYRLALAPVDAAAEHFPRLTRALGAPRVAGLLALSYFVGMVCPGLNSIFAGVSLRFDGEPDPAAAVRFDVDRYDERFHLFHVTLGGVFQGRLTAFRRPPPQRQPEMAEIAAHVARDEFAASRSLVIGGSRGLGETVAKLLAAGGGEVTLTYAQGRDDAERVRAEIDARHPGRTRVRQLDVAADDWGAVPFAEFDAVYLFATPRIGRKKVGMFSAALLDEFLAAYAGVLHRLCDHVEGLALPQPIRVYVPSTVFIDERPEGFVEYAMAKAATEVLIDEINRTLKRVKVLSTRLPRLSTDQTSSVLKVSTADTIAALLPAVRAMTAAAPLSAAPRGAPAGS